MTFIRPVIDLWLFIPSLHTEISKIEARFIKEAMNINNTTSTDETYINFAYEKPILRAVTLSKNYYKNGLIPALPVPDNLTQLKSGKTVLPDNLCDNHSLKEQLSRFYISNKHLITSDSDSLKFDVASFIRWRRNARKAIAAYASGRSIRK